MAEDRTPRYLTLTESSDETRRVVETDRRGKRSKRRRRTRPSRRDLDGPIEGVRRDFEPPHFI